MSVTRGIPEVLEAAVDISSQEVLDWVTRGGTVKLQAAPEILVEVLLNGGAMEIDAKF